MIRLLYICNDPAIGEIAQSAGVDWIFVDLEYRGKSLRQAGRDTVISAHTISDVLSMRKVLRRSKLLVRINPVGAWSKEEIEAVVSAGADWVMLPYFKTRQEVETFCDLVANRVKIALLLETLEAINTLGSILSVGGISYVHLGLNDIHIARGTTFMFEYLADGGVDKIAKQLRAAHIPFGFGGIAKIGELLPPAERILAEHYRLGSSGVILSRSFCSPTQADGTEAFKELFHANVEAVRREEAQLAIQTPDFFERNRLQVQREVFDVVAKLKDRIEGNG